MVFDTLLAALTALGLLGYLGVALIRPDLF